jgi:hypothetical protein
MNNSKLKTLQEIDDLLAKSLGKLNRIAGGAYIGSLRELKDLVGVKLKIEQIKRRISAGILHYERSSTRATKK